MEVFVEDVLLGTPVVLKVGQGSFRIDRVNQLENLLGVGFEFFGKFGKSTVFFGLVVGVCDTVVVVRVVMLHEVAVDLFGHCGRYG